MNADVVWPPTTPAGDAGSAVVSQSRAMLTHALKATPTDRQIQQYMPLVRQIVAKVLRRVPPSVLRDDLISAGVYGLVDCLRRNDGTTGAAFEAYARIRIRGAVMDELRRLEFVPRHHRERAVSASVVWMEDLARDGEEFELLDATAIDASAVLEGAAESRTLVAAVDALPPRERAIIRMRYFESKSVHEIATELSLSDPRVSQLHARAVTRLRDALAA